MKKAAAELTANYKKAMNALDTMKLPKISTPTPKGAQKKAATTKKATKGNSDPGAPARQMTKLSPVTGQYANEFEPTP
jgi:hypothetical protein